MKKDRKKYSGRSTLDLDQIRERWTRHYLGNMVAQEDGCHLLEGMEKDLHPSGYYDVSIGGYGSVPAYRIAWALSHDMHPLDMPKRNEKGQRLCLAHLCGDAACCNPEHLIFATYSENMHHTLIHHCGNKHLNAKKLTIEEKREVRKEWSKGANQVALAREYGVSQPSIHYIIRQWKDPGEAHDIAPKPWKKE